MPLAGAVAMAAPVPTAPPAAEPEIAPASSAPASDPFGFDDAFAGEEHTSSGDQTTTTEEPASATTDASQAEGSPFASAAVTPAAVADLASPTETDHFMTPPTSAAVPTSAVEEKPAEFECSGRVLNLLVAQLYFKLLDLLLLLLVFSHELRDRVIDFDAESD